MKYAAYLMCQLLVAHCRIQTALTAREPRQRARWHPRPRPRSCTGPGIQSSNCFNALSLIASLKKKLWGNKESSLLWNNEADSFKGNKEPYQEFLQVCRTLPLWDIISSILGKMCHCSFNLWLPGDTEVYRLETKRKKKELAGRKGKSSQISLKQKIIKLYFSSPPQQRIRKEIDIGKL